MHKKVDRFEMIEVYINKEFTYYLRRKLEHVVVYVPRSFVIFQLIKYGKSWSNDRENDQGVFIYRFGSH